jgi:DNA polymerase-2
VDQDSLERVPGGGIITPRAGLYENVLVFDFKSLYPSIMRTFNIDPLTRVAKRSPQDAAPQGELITAPNGERFRREPGIIPEILHRFFESREKARREANRAAIHAYKIVMNSFYGVLGTDGCRFAASGLAGAVTTFGQHILFWTRDKARERGYEVLYGDTDSLFVLSGLPRGTDAGALEGAGAALAADLNSELGAYVAGRYEVEPRLELEFEGVYRRFFLPPIRTGAAERDGEGPGLESENRGRAKGYAGMRAAPGTAEERLEIVGMEAVRHDWTRLARDLQTDLLGWVFSDVPAAEIEDRIRSRLRRLRAGELDGELVYRKVLRKPVEAYTRSSPPHVKAAAQLPPEERSGTIRYLWTREGPQPETARIAPLDYEHYAEKQMRPIVEAVAPYAGLDPERIFAAGGQLALF